MSKPKKDKFYLVQEDILPEAIKKTIKVKEILKLGEVKTINEAVFTIFFLYKQTHQAVRKGELSTIMKLVFDKADLEIGRASCRERV